MVKVTVTLGGDQIQDENPAITPDEYEFSSLAEAEAFILGMSIMEGYDSSKWVIDSDPNDITVIVKEIGDFGTAVRRTARQGNDASPVSLEQTANALFKRATGREATRDELNRILSA